MLDKIQLVDYGKYVILEKRKRKKMNLNRQNWTKEDYEEYLIYLKEKKEEEYAKFQKKIISTKYEILGIRVPIQRKIAKEINRGNAISFLQLCQNNYYEEINIQGFVIAGLKEEKNWESYFDSFLLKIDNWAICDSFCASVKRVAQSKEYYWNKIQKLIKSPHPFVMRVGLVLLLYNYVEQEYIGSIISNVFKIQSEEYYVNMAIAWLMAEMYIKYPKDIYPVLKEKKLNSFIQNKTISKICDSYRVSKEDKERLKLLKK